MANGFTVRMDGLERLLETLKKAPEEIQDQVKGELSEGVKEIQGQAKLAAPVNYGTLWNSIKVDPPENGGLIQSVTAHAEYSAFVEFGTGTKVEVPEGVEEYALQFKGEHEIPGMHARPFLFPAVFRQTPVIIDNIRKRLNKILNRA